MRAAAHRIVETVRVSGLPWTASLVLDRLLPVGVLGLWPERRIAPDALAGQLRSIVLGWGMSEEHASITVDHMLYADLHGIDSHGSGMLLHYHRGIAAGSIAATPVVETVRQSATTALVDGGGGLGHVPADTAMRLAIGKCREAGTAAVAVRNSGHFGAAGAYAALAAEAGMIGMVTTSTAQPAVVPTFGLEAMLGTNAIALAAPAARNRPFLLDMATSTASHGKVTAAWRGGRSIPAGWAIDRKGRPVTSGRRAAGERRLTPLGSSPELGSHKGYGLGTTVEILSSVLPGAGVGHLFVAIDPRRFREEGEFEADLDALLDSLRASTPIDPSRPVMVAGDPERAARAERERSGIRLPRAVLEDIRSVARASGAPFVLDA